MSVNSPWLALLHEQVLALELQALDLQPAVQAVANSFTGAGFAPERLSVSILTQHPGLSGLGYIWTREDNQVAFLERPPGFLDSEEHRASPLHHVMTHREPLFLDEEAIRTHDRFPIVRDFAKAGATSYLVQPLPTARGDIHILALWTARAGGWSASDTAQLSRVAPLLSLLIEVVESRRLLGIIGTAHEVSQRALAEQALRNADALVQQQAADMARLEAERQARLLTERQLQERSRDLAERNAALSALTASLEEKVLARTTDLEAALARANAATLAKSRFLAMMSHEIRTPMHGVLGLGELLARTPLNADQARYVSTIHSTGVALLSLLNGILDFSKIEANRFELESVPLDPVRLLDEIVVLMKGAAMERGLSFNVRCAPEVPRAVIGDPTRLRQVLINLIGNAVKFTERGEVSVTLDVVARSAGRVSLRGQVTDTGPGIPPEAMAQLFEPFAQGDSSTARRFGGTGLGLAICKGLVEQMGGSLTAASRVGEGSSFTFQVQLTLATEPLAQPAPDPARDVSELAGLRVLVVDDNPVNRLVTERQLLTLSTQLPVMAESGFEALEKLQQKSFDVVLMDIQMPGMDGLETTRELRRLRLGAQPRVIGMTANAFPEDRLACLDAGMDDFMSKPIALSTLRDALRQALPQT